MKSSPEKLPDKFVLFWDQKLVQLLGGKPWMVALLVAFVLFTSFYVLAAGTGIYVLMQHGGMPETSYTLGLDPYTWAALVTSMLTGFAISASSLAIVREEKDLKQAASLLARDPEELAAEWLEFQKRRVGRGRMVSIFFYAVGWGVVLINIPGAADLFGFGGDAVLPWYQQVPATWFLIVVPFNFSLIGKGIYFTISEERYQRRLRAINLTVDIFHPEQLAPFNRMALRRCFLWSIGSSIGLLFFLNDAIEPDGLAPFLAAIFLVALATLIGPLLGIHQKIAEAKERELSAVRDLIVSVKDQLMTNEPMGGNVAQKLSGLIAYEGRLEQISEWPLDLPTVGKFSLYMGIPVFSWLGGALMERLVDLFF